MNGTKAPISRNALLDLFAEGKKRLNIGPTTLERLAGVSKDSVRDFERGKSHLIRVDRLEKVLNVIGYELTISKI